MDYEVLARAAAELDRLSMPEAQAAGVPEHIRARAEITETLVFQTLNAYAHATDDPAALAIVHDWTRAKARARAGQSAVPLLQCTRRLFHDGDCVFVPARSSDPRDPDRCKGQRRPLPAGVVG